MLRNRPKVMLGLFEPFDRPLKLVAQDPQRLGQDVVGNRQLNAAVLG